MKLDNIKKIDKHYLANYGLIGTFAVGRVFDLYTTYMGLEKYPEFISESNLLMKKILSNKPLTYLLNAGYVSLLTIVNYLCNKASKRYKAPFLNELSTIGLSVMNIGNIYAILNNLEAIKNIEKRKML